ncbi:hypothetical protein PRIPAC_96300 [Pristionchus pacificus]|uniref:G protein-coupled receptor n=1 Tax=Pristionchus pacificus TaxID=54126 RepID=A0A2A6D3B0_PRIPA|nr:hypothetical protein PRIPAC_96300 [Pristionchus pacificus]|eukprot:PDM84797.1 G protein-coupled receptor [Pristionchus pacificus]
MYTTADSLHIALLATIDISAMLTNFIYINAENDALIFASPHEYCMCGFSRVVLQFNNFGGRIVLIYIGPCEYINAQWCHLFLVANVNFLAHSVILLVLSFAYRLWIVTKGTKAQRKQSRLWTASLLFIFAFFLLNAVIVIVKCRLTDGALRY